MQTSGRNQSMPSQWLNKHNLIIDWKKEEIKWQPLEIDWKGLLKKGQKIRRKLLDFRQLTESSTVQFQEFQEVESEKDKSSGLSSVEYKTKSKLETMLLSGYIYISNRQGCINSETGQKEKCCA